MRIEDVPPPATDEDAEGLHLDWLLLGFNVRDAEGRRVEPRVLQFPPRRTAPILSLPLALSEPLALIGAAANGEG